MILSIRGRAGKWALMGLLAMAGAQGQFQMMGGRVVMEDGSAPPKPALIQRYCGPNRVMVEGVTNGKGEYRLSPTQFESIGEFGHWRMSGAGALSCYLRASLPGYDSTLVSLDDLRLTATRRLPDLVLKKKKRGAAMEAAVDAPKPARKAWDAAQKALDAGQWAQAALELRRVVSAAPRFAAGWRALGTCEQRAGHLDEARKAFEQAVAVEPRATTSLLLLMKLEGAAKNWEAAARRAGEAIERDAGPHQAEAYLHRAVARFHLMKWADAEQDAREAVRLDARRRLPGADYVLGLILEGRNKREEARASYRRSLELEPNGVYAQAARNRSAHLDEPAAPVEAAALDAVSLEPKSVRDVWAPGGLKALARIAHMEGEPAREGFFAAYTRALVRYMDPSNRAGIPGYQDSLRAYFSAVVELSTLGETSAGTARLKVSAATPAERAHASKVLSALGWRLAQRDGVAVAEFGEAPSDVARHPVAGALGIDMIALRQALKAGRAFEFEIASEDAPLLGGDAWLAPNQDRRALAGGLAEAFLRDLRLAKVYTGMSAAGPEAAAELARAVGMAEITARHATTIERYGEAFRIAEGKATTPGGVECEAVWAALAGVAVSPPAPFFRALLEADQGRLAAFYAGMARLDKARVRYILASRERAAAIYQAHSPASLELYAAAPVEDGELRCPGGKELWPAEPLASSDAPLFLRLAQLESRRGRPFTRDEARLLKQHGADWAALADLLARVPETGIEHLEAISAFEASLKLAPPRQAEIRLGLWAAGAELLAIEREKSSRQVAAELLALTKSASGATAGKAALDAMTARVYAAWIDPRALVMSEDPAIVARHRYMADTPGPVFRSAALEASSRAPGSRFTGIFAGFGPLAAGLERGRKVEQARVAEAEPRGPAGAAGEGSNAEHVFRSEARLVEVYATVTDGRGRYIDDLKGDEFEVREEGRAADVTAFESRTTGLSCALLLDATLSMYPSLATLKNAALGLIDEVRPSDAVAVYRFSDSVTLEQPAETGKDGALRAVARQQAGGETALYDAIVRVIGDFSAERGKKVIVVFTDGDDNKSTLTAEAATRRAKAAGIPVYTIAQGMALENRALLRDLEQISRSTGGLTFGVKEAREIEAVFDAIAKDLAHGYLLAFRPGAGQPGQWRKLDVVLKGGRAYKVRAREGYQRD